MGPRFDLNQDAMDTTDQTDQTDSLLAFSPWPLALDSKLSALRIDETDLIDQTDETAEIDSQLAALPVRKDRKLP